MRKKIITVYVHVVKYENSATCRAENQQMSAQLYISLLLTFLILKVKISRGKVKLFLRHLLHSPWKSGKIFLLVSLSHSLGIALETFQ